MQRIPSGRTPLMTAQPPYETSPLLLMARRIREEQGVEQVRAFLAAMTPFAAPNEIRHVAEGFGLSWESLERERQRRTPEPVMNSSPQRNQGGLPDQLNQLRTVMQLAGMMKNGGDPMSLISMLSGK